MRRLHRRSDGWTCPRCGQNGIRHGRAGARACKGNRDKKHCAGLHCECGDGVCHDPVHGWRHSPCPSAHCHHCGWKGEVRSKWFERRAGDAKCRVSPSSWHDTVAQLRHNAEPGPLCIELVCSQCGAVGGITADPVDDVVWTLQKHRAPHVGTPEVGSSTADSPSLTKDDARTQPAKSCTGVEGSEEEYVKPPR